LVKFPKNLNKDNKNQEVQSNIAKRVLFNEEKEYDNNHNPNYSNNNNNRDK
jgi:hypothetical protein